MSVRLTDYPIAGPYAHGQIDTVARYYTAEVLEPDCRTLFCRVSGGSKREVMKLARAERRRLLLDTAAPV